MSSEKKFSFQAKVEQFNNQLWDWYFLVPEEISDYFMHEQKTRRVICIFNEVQTKHCALMSDGNGLYYINLNKDDKKALKIQLGDLLKITIEKDTSKYGYPVAPEMKELLDIDPEGSDFFHQLTPGKQRSLLHIIGQPKRSETRLKRAIAILDYLKDNQGQLNFRELNQALKDANNKFY